MLSAFQKELMTKLKTGRPETDPERKDQPDGPTESKDEEKTDAAKEAEGEPTKLSPTPAQGEAVKSQPSSPTDSQPAGPKSAPSGLGDETDEAFNFDLMTSEARLSSEAALHKIGVVRKAVHKRHLPARVRSSESAPDDTSEPQRIGVRTTSLMSDSDELDASVEEKSKKDSDSAGRSPPSKSPKRTPSDVSKQLAQKFANEEKEKEKEKEKETPTAEFQVSAEPPAHDLKKVEQPSDDGDAIKKVTTTEEVTTVIRRKRYTGFVGPPKPASTSAANLSQSTSPPVPAKPDKPTTPPSAEASEKPTAPPFTSKPKPTIPPSPAKSEKPKTLLSSSNKPTTPPNSAKPEIAAGKPTTPPGPAKPEKPKTPPVSLKPKPTTPPTSSKPDKPAAALSSTAKSDRPTTPPSSTKPDEPTTPPTLDKPDKPSSSPSTQYSRPRPQRHSVALDMARRFEASGAHGGPNKNNSSEVNAPLPVKAISKTKFYGSEKTADEPEASKEPAERKRSTATMQVTKAPAEGSGRSTVYTKSMTSPDTSPSTETSPQTKPADDKAGGVSSTSPRKYSQPIFPASTRAAPAKPPLVRKASEPYIGQRGDHKVSAEPVRLRRLSETPSSPSKTGGDAEDKTTSPASDNKRAPSMVASRVGALKETGVPPGSVQIRKLSVNANERPRSKVMDMMKKFET